MSHMDNQVFKGSKGYQLFLSAYKAKIRPDGHLKRMEKGLGLDAEFKSRFDIFRKILKKSSLDWGKEVVFHLHSQDAFTKPMEERDLDCLGELYRHHTRLFRVGRFDESYLSSVENIALMFIHYDVKTIWLAGAYRELTDAHIDLVVDEVAKSQTTPLAHSMKALTLALTTELNQIQRVYTMYERIVSDNLVKDLTYAGMLTGMPQGRKIRPNQS